MNPAETNRQPKFARTLERAQQTHKHARSTLELAERLADELVGSAPQPPSPEGERPVPGNLADRLDEVIVATDRCIDRIENHLARLAAEMQLGPAPEGPRHGVAIAR